MNIFFTGSIRGGRAHLPEYAFIVKTLEQFGTVHSKHVHDETLSHYGETGLSAQEIFEREIDALSQSDIVVADVSTPSLGVGYLVALASSLGKKTIALYHGDDTLKLSAIIKGDSGVEVYTYKTEEDITKILNEVLQ